VHIESNLALYRLIVERTLGRDHSTDRSVRFVFQKWLLPVTLKREPRQNSPHQKRALTQRRNHLTVTDWTARPGHDENRFPKEKALAPRTRMVSKTAAIDLQICNPAETGSLACMPYHVAAWTEVQTFTR
jgi:hypothetical protein